MPQARSKTAEKRPKAESVAGRKQPVKVSEPTREEIEQRAHDLYLARGGAPGYDLEDWLQAERELREANSGTKGISK